MKRRLLIFLPLVVVTAIAAVMWAVLFGGEGLGEDPQIDADETSAMLAGRVIDTAGRPVGGAHVFAEDAATTTDGDGRFSFEELGAGEVRVDVTAEGHRRGGVDDLGRPTVDLTDGEPVEDLELILPRAASLSGRVLAGGEPVEGADISLSYVFSEGLQGEDLPPYIVSKLAHTDERGRFSIPEIAPGRLQILVESGPHPFIESDDLYFRPGQSRDDVVVDLAPSGRLEGSVVAEDGAGIASADVRVIPSATEGASRLIETDDDGNFGLYELTEGTYSLWVEATGYRDETIDELEVTADVTTDIEVTLERSRGLFGRVVEPDGTPVDEAHVLISDGEDARRIRTDANGQFEWEEVEPGDWTAVASSPRHQSSREVALEFDEEAILEIDPGGRIEGSVVDPEGDPVSEYSIEIGAMEPDGEIRYRSRHMPTEQVRDDEGRFQFGPLRSGRYRLVVKTDDYAPATTPPLTVSAGDTTGPVVVQLEGGGTVEGIVRDAETGEPIEGVEVRFLMRTGDNRPPRTRTDADGHYRLDGLPSGRSSLRFAQGHYNFELIGGLYVPDGGRLTHDVDLEPIEPGDQPGQYLQGIGATLHHHDDGFRVAGTGDDSPAVAAGIEENDVIVGIDGDDASEMTIDMAVELIRGEPGEAVTLRVRRPGRGTRTVEVDRERVFIPQDRPVRPRE